jgi:hypothetical protein
LSKKNVDGRDIARPTKEQIIFQVVRKSLKMLEAFSGRP